MISVEVKGQFAITWEQNPPRNAVENMNFKCAAATSWQDHVPNIDRILQELYSILDAFTEFAHLCRQCFRGGNRNQLDENESEQAEDIANGRRSITKDYQFNRLAPKKLSGTD